MHFILEVELKDPPTAPGLALADDKADSGTYTRNIRTHMMKLIIGSMLVSRATPLNRKERGVW